MKLINCPSCGWPYLPGEASYCTKCGTSLSKSINPAQEIKQLESQPKPYEALRFTSGLMIFFGWLVIIGVWVSVSMTYTFTVSMAENMVSDAVSYTVVSNLAVLISILFGMAGTILGITLIASGQVFQVMLDIRNDMNLTARLVRRFGLLMSEDQRPTSN